MKRMLVCIGLLMFCVACTSPAVAPTDPVGGFDRSALVMPVSEAASRPQEEDHGWVVGPVSAGTQTGFVWTVFTESSQMELTDESLGPAANFFLERTGVKLGYSTGTASFSLVGASANTYAEDAGGADTSGDWAGGVSGGLTFLPTERFGIGVDITWLWGSADYSDAFDSGTLDYTQADARLGIAYRPSADAMFAFAPVVGLGYRVFDSAASPDNGFGYDIDGDGTYVFLGGSLAWRRGPGKTSMAVEVLALAGDVYGIVISIPFSYLDLPPTPSQK